MASKKEDGSFKEFLHLASRSSYGHLIWDLMKEQIVFVNDAMVKITEITRDLLMEHPGVVMNALTEEEQEYLRIRFGELKHQGVVEDVQVRLTLNQTTKVLSLSAYGGLWNSAEKISANLTALGNESAPFFFAEIGGSGANGDSSVDHTLFLQKGVGDKAFVLSAPWTTSEDALAFTHTLPTTFDTTGATYSFDLYLPRQYQSDGNLTVQLYLEDAEGVAAGVGSVAARDLRPDTWNRVRMKTESMENMFALNGQAATVVLDTSSIAKVGL